ncbi:MAG: hypothetical protein ABI351_11485, partial [Herbaspirillum sp.]
QTQYTSRHCILCVSIFQLYGTQKQRFNFVAKFPDSQMQISHLHGVDQIDSRITVHRIITQNVLALS